MPTVTSSRRPATVTGRPSKAEMLARAAGRRRPYRRPDHSRARLALVLLGCLLLLVAATVAGVLVALT